MWLLTTYITSSSAVVERLRNASYLSKVSFNNTIRRMHSSVCYSYFHFRFTIKCCSVVFGITMTLLVISTSSSSPAINKLHRLLPTMSVTTCHCLPASCWQHLAIAAFTACDKARHWWRITIFAYPPAFNGPIRGVPIGILQHVWCEKTMTVWLPDGENFLKICLLNSTEYTNVTDRQTDRHRTTAQATLMHGIAWQKC